MNSKKSRIASRALAPLLFLPLASCGPTAPSAKILDYGTYDAVVLTRGDWRLGIPVSLVSVEQLEHREDSTRIPCQDGSYWGMRVELSNPTNEPIKFIRICQHPEFTDPAGNASSIETS